MYVDFGSIDVMDRYSVKICFGQTTYKATY